MMLRVDVYVETRAEIEFTPHKCLGQEIKDMLSLHDLIQKAGVQRTVGGMRRKRHSRGPPRPCSCSQNQAPRIKRWYPVILRHFEKH